MSSKIKPAQLQAAFRADIAAAWNKARQLHPDHSPYAFVLYGVWFKPCVLTKEGLTQEAQRQVEEGSLFDTLDEAQKNLRYSPPDWPGFEDKENMLETVPALLKQIGPYIEDMEGYEVHAKAAMSAFKELDEQGLFGTAKQREQLLLMLMPEDSEKDWAGLSAKKLNPAPVLKRLKEETKIEGVFAMCDSLAVSPDGRSLFFGGSRESVPEVVACNIAGLRLRRRWGFTLGHSSACARRVAYGQDGKTVVVLISKCVNETAHTQLLQFGCDGNKVLREKQWLGNSPASLALSRDGSRIAVGMGDKSLHLLDDAFNVLRIHKVENKLGQARFLNSGELLVVTEKGVIRLDKTFETSNTVTEERAHSLVVDDLETKLVVARWFDPYPLQDEAGEFGLQILELPSLKPLRTILLPGHQLVTPAISADGRLVAFEATEIITGHRKKFVAVVEIATGREIARRKSDFVKAMQFLRDSRTLAISEGGFTTGEPIVLWAIPDLEAARLLQPAVTPKGAINRNQG